MVATMICGIVLAGVLTANFQIMRSGVRITQHAEMSAQIRRALDQLGRDLKNASAIKWNSSSDITLTLPTSSGSTTQVTYAWTSATQNFFMVPGADSSVATGRILLVTGIPALADGSAGVVFARRDRDNNAATTDNATKRVQVIFNAVRKSERSADATDTAVSAFFTLRNKPTS